MQPEQLNTAADWPADPITLFRDWFETVKADGQVPEPETMTLCSATTEGRPSARIVFLRGLDHGFCFYTNYESRKGRELTANPRAALVFHWRDPYVQVRVEGSVETMTAEESDAYFDSRERSKRLSAMVSEQSRPIDSWTALRAAADRLMESGTAATRPDHWGGYRILPDRMEFWVGSQDRMHRRCEYSLAGDTWNRQLLAP